MSHLSMIMSALFSIAMLIFIAPGIFALNRGHILRNVALWLAIIFGLALIYQNFGPDSPHPLFNAPASMRGMNRNEAPKLVAPSVNTQDNKQDDSGANGYTPPKE